MRRKGKRPSSWKIKKKQKLLKTRKSWCPGAVKVLCKASLIARRVSLQIRLQITIDKALQIKIRLSQLKTTLRWAHKLLLRHLCSHLSWHLSLRTIVNRRWNHPSEIKSLHLIWSKSLSSTSSTKTFSQSWKQLCSKSKKSFKWLATAAQSVMNTLMFAKLMVWVVTIKFAKWLLTVRISSNMSEWTNKDSKLLSIMQENLRMVPQLWHTLRLRNLMASMKVWQR